MQVVQLTDRARAAEAGGVVQAGYFVLPGYPREQQYDAEIADVGARLDAGEVVAIAEDEGRIVGCVTYAGAHSPTYEFGDRDGATFRYFAVLPAAQGRGVGEAMVRWCVERARADGWARIRIHTLTMMTAAQRLYTRLGFVRDPDRDEDWDGIAGLAYVLEFAAV